MNALLILVDLQRDYLAAPGLQPPAGAVTERAARLLDAFRAAGRPVVHAWTTVDRADDRRMPHWKRLGKWQCVEGTEGHRPPPELQPLDGEPVVHKRFFSAFGTGELDRVLKQLGADTLVLAGVHLHACVRATALDAYERGYRVCIAEDAVASDDPIHAAITRRYLGDRAAEFRPAEFWSGPCDPDPSDISRIQPAVGGATASARTAARDWEGTSPEARVRLLEEWACRIEEDAGMAGAITAETGKPIRHARGEVAATAAQLRAIARRIASEPAPPDEATALVRHRALGVVAVITPWNNPIYIPAGKIGATLAHGNVAVWKPAPAASSVARRLAGHLRAAGAPEGVLGIVTGDRATALALMSDPAVDAVTLTGSSAAGHDAQEICARRNIPLQAELGGNNAAIVWSDADLPAAAAAIAEGAFAMAGQRCTANRRVVVHAASLDAFLELLVEATARLKNGDPMDPGVTIGPLVSRASRDRVDACVARARARGLRIRVPHAEAGEASPSAGAAYHDPTLILADDPRDECVREETFGPVLVVQRAADWDEAIALCNGVEQGLAAALFSRSADLQRAFLAGARAGILKLNISTAGADIDLPFGGWKSSGIGPAEHGASDREFHTRTQTVYR